MNRHHRWLLLLAGWAALIAAPLRAEEIQTIDLWPEGVPGLHPDATPEKLVDGRASNVSHPALLWYPAPAGTACGTAVVICPGGAYGWLSMQNEGASPAHWLNALGVSAWV